MGYAIAVIVVAVLAFAVIRIGAMALELTGVSRDAARFQALSAFFSVGFTTSEAEMFVNHPARRRIIRDLIIIGNIGVFIITSGVVVMFVTSDTGQSFERVGLVIVALLMLGFAIRFKAVTNLVDRTLKLTLKRSGALRVLDYESLLRIQSGFGISEVNIETDDWIANKTLGESRLRAEGVVVLGVARKAGDYIGVPKGNTRINAGDTIIIYAKDHAARDLAQRRKGPEGERAHDEATEEAQANIFNQTTPPPAGNPPVHNDKP